MKVTVINHTTNKTFTRDLENDADRIEICALAMRCHDIDIKDSFGGIIYTTCTIDRMWRLITDLM